MTYLGGHPKYPEPITRASLFIHNEGIVIRGSSNVATVSFERSEIIDLDVDGPNEVQTRVTVPRVLALGVIALAVPKKEKLAYLVISTRTGEAIIEVRAVGVMELRSIIQMMARLDGSNVLGREASVPRTSRERLVELKALHVEGLLSADEYEEQRREIIREI